MYNKNIILTLILIIGLQAIMLNAQVDPYEKALEEYEKVFDEYKKKNKELFNKYVEKNDKEFADYLDNAWKKFELNIEVKQPDNPKPTDLPVIEPIDISKKDPVNIPVEEPDDENKNKTNKGSVSPGIQKDEPEDFGKNNGQVLFYGMTIDFKYDKDILTTVETPINEQVVSGYWTKMSKTNHYSLVNQLLDYKTMMNLNDWAYYILVKDVSASITRSGNAANLLTWFLLTKSRYKTKVGFNNNNVYLLLASANMIYGRRYYPFKNINYFLIEATSDVIYSYDKDYPDAKYMFDLNLFSPISVGEDYNTRQLDFLYKDKKYNISIGYNQNAIDFYNDCPQANMKIYFDAAISPVTKESLYKNLYPLVKNKTELEATGILLHFIQTAFRYKTDQQQFNREKFFYPEEMFYYPYSDCEDRSVLFAYLVREFLGLQVVGLGYNGHMATAVNFTKDHGMDYFFYKGKKFIICDATYINAPVGMCMPKFVNQKAKIIELRTNQIYKKQEDEIWDKIIAAGGSPGSPDKNISFDNSGNAFVAGYFSGELRLGKMPIKSANRTKDAFVAKFDKNAKIKWVKRFGGAGNEMAGNVAVDRNKNCFVSGTYDRDFTSGNKKLHSNGVKNVFVAKYNDTGNLLWSNQMDIEKPDIEDDHIYVSRFDSDGNHESTVMFDETEHFDNYGISFDGGKCFVSVAFSAHGEGLATSNYNSASDYNFGKNWNELRDLLIENDCSSDVAGFLAFLEIIRINGVSISGKDIKEAINKYNPGFKEQAPKTYNVIGNIKSIENSNGIITIHTIDKKDIAFSYIIIQDNAQIRITTYKSGNTRVEVIRGAKTKANVTGFNLNSLKLIKDTGMVIIDYDNEHLKKRLYFTDDILQ